MCTITAGFGLQCKDGIGGIKKIYLNAQSLFAGTLTINGTTELVTNCSSDEDLLDFMTAHPILINRPIVVTSLGTKLCRPSEVVLDILEEPQRGAFTKEDGEVVINEKGLRV